ncbi:hypothetical protein IJ674_00955 [bacterium]|nr:hypothetical protein [bacterium]
MDEKSRQNFEVIDDTRERVNEVSEQSVVSRQTNPIKRKLLDFGLSNKTRKFSVRDLFGR